MMTDQREGDEMGTTPVYMESERGGTDYPDIILSSKSNIPIYLEIKSTNKLNEDDSVKFKVSTTGSKHISLEGYHLILVIKILRFDENGNPVEKEGRNEKKVYRNVVSCFDWDLFSITKKFSGNVEIEIASESEEPWYKKRKEVVSYKKLVKHENASYEKFIRYIEEIERDKKKKRNIAQFLLEYDENDLEPLIKKIHTAIGILAKQTTRKPILMDSSKFGTYIENQLRTILVKGRKIIHKAYRVTFSTQFSKKYPEKKLKKIAHEITLPPEEKNCNRDEIIIDKIKTAHQNKKRGIADRDTKIENNSTADRDTKIENISTADKDTKIENNSTADRDTKIENKNII